MPPSEPARRGSGDDRRRDNDGDRNGGSREGQAKGGSCEEPGIGEWLETATIPERLRVIAIDTVTQRNWISGSAAKRIAKMLGRRNVATRSFVVAGGQGPLAEGEARAARTWGAGLV